MDVVRCTSRDYRRTFCDVGRAENVRVRRQVSDARCIEGQTWGWDRRGIWVSDGCRAQFQVN